MTWVKYNRQIWNSEYIVSENPSDHVGVDPGPVSTSDGGHEGLKPPLPDRGQLIEARVSETSEARGEKEVSFCEEAKSVQICPDVKIFQDCLVIFSKQRTEWFMLLDSKEHNLPSRAWNREIEFRATQQHLIHLGVQSLGLKEVAVVFPEYGLPPEAAPSWRGQ